MSTLKQELEEARAQTIAMEKALHTYLSPAVEEATDSLGVFAKKYKDGVDTIYVTVGHPMSHIPIVKMVSVFVMEPTAVQSAKMLRKKVADNPEDYGYVEGTRFKPSELYYEAYESSESKAPFACSANSPAMNSFC